MSEEATVGTEVAVRDEGRQMAVLTNEQLQYIASTEFVPPGLRGNLPAILACVATGRALGIADMSALRSIHIIDGKATFSAELMVQLVRRAGHSIVGTVGDGEATVVGTRADNGDTMTMSFTLQMAERAGLLSKSNWRKYPEAMLWARAVSQLCRMLFADCFAGNTYTAEELQDGDALAGEPRTEAAAAQTVSAAPAAQEGQSSPAEPLITAAQKKKANVLVGQLRDEFRITTEEVYAAADADPEEYRSDDGSLHWSPLRDALTKKTASTLIDRLERYASSDEKTPPWAAGSSTSAPAQALAGDHAAAPVGALVEELLALADEDKLDAVRAAIDRNRDEHPGDDDAHRAWLAKQLDRVRAKAAA